MYSSDPERPAGDLHAKRCAGHFGILKGLKLKLNGMILSQSGVNENISGLANLKSFLVNHPSYFRFSSTLESFETLKSSIQIISVQITSDLLRK